jgi:hypothetical protein
MAPSEETLQVEEAVEEAVEEEVEEEVEEAGEEETIPQQPHSNRYPKPQTFEQWGNNQKASMAIEPKRSSS